MPFNLFGTNRSQSDSQPSSLEQLKSRLAVSRGAKPLAEEQIAIERPSDIHLHIPTILEKEYDALGTAVQNTLINRYASIIRQKLDHELKQIGDDKPSLVLLTELLRRVPDRVEIKAVVEGARQAIFDFNSKHPKAAAALKTVPGDQASDFQIERLNIELSRYTDATK